MAINDQYRPYPGTFPDIYDRSLTAPLRDRVLFREGRLTQAGEVNEALSIIERKRIATSNMVARDGDRVSGAEIIVDRDAETATLTAGTLYARGDVRPVAAAVLVDVPMAGDIIIGVRITATVVTHEDDASLLGLHPGVESTGEDGAVREVQTLAWGFSGDGEDGDLLQVYLLRNGQVVDQTPPPSYSGFAAFLAPITFGANGSYVESGCLVTPLGLSAGSQVFSVAEGVASILGYRRTRFTATRYSEPEAPDMRSIAAEPHTFDDGGTGTAVITLNHRPINSVATAIITKQATETIVRGGAANGSDLLTHPGVTSIISVVQGVTTFTATTDYVRTGDRVDWAPGGSEPAGGSSYDVTYRYLEAVTPAAVGLDTVTLTGGVTGQTVLVSYAYRLPRFDRICLDRDGNVVYLKGVPAIEQPQAPDTPATLLSLAVVQNDWRGTPVVDNDTGNRSIPFTQMWAYFRRLVDLVDLIALERLQANISFREPVAKKGVFVDPFTTDRYRDAGEAQTGAVFGGTFQLAIDPTFHSFALATAQSLNFAEEAVIRQEFVTGCTKINPYQSFSRLPAKLTITPREDFWTETNEVWLSAQTEVFGQGSQSRLVQSRVETTTTEATARFLRQISIAFTIDGFGVGETLDELLFDSLDVTPAGPLVADGNGRVTGNFTIPANVQSGSKLVVAVGGSGASALAAFTGAGKIETISRRQVSTVQRFDPMPPEPSNVIIIDGRAEAPEPGGDGSVDPVAQTFRFAQGRHVASIDVKFCAIGDRDEPVIMEIVTTDNGYPSQEVIASVTVDMQAAVVGPYHRFAFPTLPFIPAGQEVAFVLKTNDPDHSVSLAKRGGFDATLQVDVGAQPYTVGVMFSSSNARAWTAHQDEDLTFRINCPVFSPVSKTVPLGIISVTDMSDLIVEARTFLPTAAARILVEIEPEGESPVRVEPGQVYERQSYFTGNVALRAILTGSATVSPLLGREVLAIIGKIRTSGTYVSRAWAMGNDIDLNVVAKTLLPAGSTLTVAQDAGNDVWNNLTAGAAEVLPDGTFERVYKREDMDVPLGRVRLTLTGGPGARPAIADFRAWTIPT